MKGKKSFLTLLIVGVVVVLFCLPGSVFAKGPSPPIVGENEKLIGPLLKGVIIVGWRPYLVWDEVNEEFVETGFGDAEAFLMLEGKLYPGIVDKDVPEETDGGDGFLQNIAADITDWKLPCQIVEDYDMGICPDSRAVIAYEKDVSNFNIIEDAVNMGLYYLELTHKHILYCNVKVSFIIPKK